jgi:hypothetical protein
MAGGVKTWKGAVEPGEIASNETTVLRWKGAVEPLAAQLVHKYFKKHMGFHYG